MIINHKIITEIKYFRLKRWPQDKCTWAVNFNTNKVYYNSGFNNLWVENRRDKVEDYRNNAVIVKISPYTALNRAKSLLNNKKVIKEHDSKQKNVV